LNSTAIFQIHGYAKPPVDLAAAGGSSGGMYGALGAQRAG